MTIKPKTAAKILKIVLKAIHAAAVELKTAKGEESEKGKKVTEHEVVQIVEAALKASMKPVAELILSDDESK